MFAFSLIALTAVVLVGGLALRSAHIPILRNWTGAAALQDDDTARDFAANDAAGYVTRPDWGPAPIRPQPDGDAPEESPAVTAGEVTAP